MSRTARLVVPGMPHHITQRGTRRFDVFHDEADRLDYLTLLVETCREFRLSIVAYCLMTNHVHYIAIPERTNSIGRVFHRVHGTYSKRFNIKHGFVGQGGGGLPVVECGRALPWRRGSVTGLEKNHHGDNSELGGVVGLSERCSDKSAHPGVHVHGASLRWGSLRETDGSDHASRFYAKETGAETEGDERGQSLVGLVGRSNYPLKHVESIS